MSTASARVRCACKVEFCFRGTGVASRFRRELQGGLRPTFRLWGVIGVNLEQLVGDAVRGLGYELVDVEMAGGRTRLMRVFIDRPEGIHVEDCARVSSQLTRVFAVENVDYDRLEVSSPGLDRKLKSDADFTRFTGAQVDITLRLPVAGRRRWSGKLLGIVDDAVEFEVDTGVLRVARVDLEVARLVPIV